MKKNWKGFCLAVALGASIGLTSCGGNNGDLPKEDNYENTTETAPESTDNLTGDGMITDSTDFGTAGAANDSTEL